MKKSTKAASTVRQDQNAVTSPPLSNEQLAALRPAREVMPDLVAAHQRRTRGRGKAAPKTRITIRLDTEVVEQFKATGKGWQTRMNEILKASISFNEILSNMQRFEIANRQENGAAATPRKKCKKSA